MFRNEQVLLHKKDGDVISYCVLSDRDVFQQVKDVFTFPQFRGKGYAKALLSHIVKHARQPLYLICRSELQSFYQSVGFSQSTDIPEYMAKRVQKVNVLIGRFLKRVHVVMESGI